MSDYQCNTATVGWFKKINFKVDTGAPSNFLFHLPVVLLMQNFSFLFYLEVGAQ